MCWVGSYSGDHGGSCEGAGWSGTGENVRCNRGTDDGIFRFSGLKGPYGMFWLDVQYLE